jgi:hypothetical protein
MRPLLALRWGSGLPVAAQRVAGDLGEVEALAGEGQEARIGP